MKGLKDATYDTVLAENGLELALVDPEGQARDVEVVAGVGLAGVKALPMSTQKLVSANGGLLQGSSERRTGAGRCRGSRADHAARGCRRAAARRRDRGRQARPTGGAPRGCRERQARLRAAAAARRRQAQGRPKARRSGGRSRLSRRRRASGRVVRRADRTPRTGESARQNDREAEHGEMGDDETLRRAGW